MVSTKLGVLVFACFQFSSVLGGSSELENCTINSELTSSTEKGFCVPLKECRPMIHALRLGRNKSVVICDRAARTICCPEKYFSATEAPKVHDKMNVGSRGSFEDVVELVVEPEIVKKCYEYKSLLFKNETVNSFTLGESSFVNSTPFCNQNKADNGITSEDEFPHIAIIKLQNRFLPRNHHERETKCVGSLISHRHVLTSVFCVSSDRNFKVSVQLGANNYSYDESQDPKIIGNNYEVEDIIAKYGVSLLKLSRSVEFSEHVMPVCLFPDEAFVGDTLLVAWNGDWRECDPILKKWHINQELIEKRRWQYKFEASAIINYRETLLPGSPLQIYHPDNTCQYSLIGVFEQFLGSDYWFNSLQHKLRWIEGIAWPKRLQHMHEKAYQIMKKGLKVL